jgi:hypothetical protein
MIRVKLELIPGGVGDIQHLGTIEIANQFLSSVRTNGMRGDYSYEIQKKIEGKITHTGMVYDFPRLSYHPWNLVRQILNDAPRRGVI